MAIDGLNTVARGVEGSGEAQILNVDPVLKNAFQNLRAQALQEEAQRLERAKAANKVLRSELKGYPDQMDVEEYTRLRGSIADSVTKSQQVTGSYADEFGSEPERKLASGSIALQSFAAASKKAGEAYRKALENVGNPDIDQEELKEGILGIENAKTLKERLSYLDKLNVPSVNWAEAVREVGTSTYLRQVENGGITTTTEYFDSEDFKNGMLEFLTTDEKGKRAYEWGVRKGLWSDYDGAVASAEKIAKSGVKESYKRTEDEEKGGGLNMNFGGGGAHESGDWKLQPYDSKTASDYKVPGKGLGVKGTALSVSYKGGNTKEIVLNNGVDDEGNPINVKGYIQAIEFPNNRTDKARVVFKVGGSNQEGEEKLKTIRLPFNEENMGITSNLMGVDWNQAFQNLGVKGVSSVITPGMKSDRTGKKPEKKEESANESIDYGDYGQYAE